MNESVSAPSEKGVRLKTWSERSADEKLDALRDHIEVLTHRLQECRAAALLLERDTLRNALCRISLTSKNSGSSKEVCGQIAREALAATEQ